MDSSLNDGFPSEGVMIWTFIQGLKGRDWSEFASSPLPKRYQNETRYRELYKNWMNGYQRHWLYGRNYDFTKELPPFIGESDLLRKEWKNLDDYPLYKGWEKDGLPCFDPTGVENRWVPCIGTRPLIRWGSGCMSEAEARAWPKATDLAENLYGTRCVCVDIDGDHGDELYWPVIKLGADLARSGRPQVRAAKRKTIDHDDVKRVMGITYLDRDMYSSMHLVYYTDRVIPTQHYPHLDIIGNERNSIIYWKDKQVISKGIKLLDNHTWRLIQDYVENERSKK